MTAALHITLLFRFLHRFNALFHGKPDKACSADGIDASKPGEFVDQAGNQENDRYVKAHQGAVGICDGRFRVKSSARL